MAKGLSVRAVEALVKKEADLRENGPPPHRPSRSKKDVGTLALEKRIAERVGLAIAIKHKGGGGEVKVKYANLDQLDKLVAMLGA